MIRSIKPITRRVGPVVVMSMMLYYQPAYAAGADSSSSVTSRIKDELNNAISDFRLLANDIRGDKPSKHEIAVGSDQASIYAYNTINNNDVTARAYSLRNAARQNKLPSAYHEQSTELTLYQHGVIGRQNYSRLGAYLRVEPLESIEETSSFMADQNKEGYSLTLGGDYLFNEHYLFGVALGLPFGEAEEETAKSEIDGLVASGYFSFFRDDWYVDFTASYALIDTDIERRISLYSDSVINDTNQADSDIWVFSLGGGYIINYNYLNIAFESSIQYTLSDTDRYDERLSKDNSNYLISKVDNIDNLESTMLIAGVSVSHPFRSSLGIFQPYMRGYVHYDIDSGTEKIISQLKADNSGSILPIIVDSDDSLYGRLHLGISGAFNRDWRGYVEASTLIGLDDLSAYTLTFGLSMSLH